MAIWYGISPPRNTEISRHRPCVRCATIRIARLAFIRLAFVPRGTAEWLARVDRVRWTLAIGDWRFCPSKLLRFTDAMLALHVTFSFLKLLPCFAWGMAPQPRSPCLASKELRQASWGTEPLRVLAAVHGPLHPVLFLLISVVFSLCCLSVCSWLGVFYCLVVVIITCFGDCDCISWRFAFRFRQLYVLHPLFISRNISLSLCLSLHLWGSCSGFLLSCLSIWDTQLRVSRASSAIPFSRML